MNTNDSKNTVRFIRTTLIVAAGVAATFLSACNTVEGAGKDLQESSQNVKDAISN